MEKSDSRPVCYTDTRTYGYFLDTFLWDQVVGLQKLLDQFILETGGVLITAKNHRRIYECHHVRLAFIWKYIRGEVLLGLIANMFISLGWWSLPIVMPLEMIWIGFSLFIGAIQAYVFVTLTMVFMSHKIVAEH